MKETRYNICSMTKLENLKDLSNNNENIVKRLTAKLKTKQRYKVMANGSPAGQKTVHAYQCNDIADDSND